MEFENPVFQIDKLYAKRLGFLLQELRSAELQDQIRVREFLLACAASDVRTRLRMASGRSDLLRLRDRS